MEQLLVKNIGTLIADTRRKPCLCGEEMSLELCKKQGIEVI